MSAASYRMKIPLPLDNDTWFAFDENLTVYEILATMIEEDAHIQTISLNVPDKSKKLRDIFATSKTYELEINGITYKMEYETIKEIAVERNFSKKPIDDLVPLIL